MSVSKSFCRDIIKSIVPNERVSTICVPDARYTNHILIRNNDKFTLIMKSIDQKNTIEQKKKKFVRNDTIRLNDRMSLK